MSEKIVKANGVDICTETFGDRKDPAILLIMGATASMLRWDDDLCQRLADAGRFVIRYDNRDTGRSVTYDPGTCPYTVEDMADDAVGVLDAYGIERAHIVGASMGGMITQQVGLRHPERAITLTPIMSTPDPTAVMAAVDGEEIPAGALPAPTNEVILAALAGAQLDWADEAAVIDNAVSLWQVLSGPAHPFDEKSARDITVNELKRASNYRSNQNHLLAITNTPRWRDRLSEIKIPTLVIHGDADPILPYPHGVALADAIPGARLLTMKGVGHEMPRPEWDTIVPAVLEHTSVD